MANVPSSGNPKDEIRVQLAPGASDTVLERLIRNSGGIYKLTAAQYAAITNKNPEHIYIVDGVLQVNQGSQALSVSGAPDALVKGQSYSFTPTSSNGSGTKKYSIRGSLPQGLGFDSTTGTVSGTPTSGASTRDVYIAVTDDTGTATLGPLFFGPSATAIANLPSLYLGQVATRSYIPNAVNTNFKQFNSRSPHFARDAITSLQVVLANWCCDQQNGRVEKGSGGTATYSASVEYPSGTFTPINFGGSATSPTVADGDNIVSDATTVSIPEGALFWVRVYGVMSVGLVFVSNATGTASSLTPRDTINGQTFEFSASAIANKTLSGTIAQTSTSSLYTPVGIIAQTRKPSVFVHGDSRAWHANDTIDASGDTGEVTRSIGGFYGYINTAVYGDTASAHAGTGFAKRGALAAYCSHVISEIGINDNAAASVIRSRKDYVFSTYFIPRGMKIYETTITPKTTGTFGTGGSQTVDANNGNRVAFNDSIRNGNATGVSGYFEVADVVETARNSGIWKDNYTDDGVHGIQLSNLAIKNSGNINPATIVRLAA